MLPNQLGTDVIFNEIFLAAKQSPLWPRTRRASLRACHILEEREGIWVGIEGCWNRLGKNAMHKSLIWRSRINIWSSGSCWNPDWCCWSTAPKPASKPCETLDWEQNICLTTNLSIRCMGCGFVRIENHFGRVTNNGWWWGPWCPKLLSNRVSTRGCIRRYCI